MKKIFSDIFNEDIKSSRLSYGVNLFIIFLIILSTMEIILQTESSLSKYEWLFDIVYYFTSILFVMELLLRFIFAGSISKEYMSFLGKLKFLVNFYTIIDILAVLPFILGLIGIETLIFLKALRVLRILKIMRYMPSVDLLIRAVTNKKSELLISLQVIFITSIILSICLYYAESRMDKTQFSSISQAFLWSVAKFIGGIAGYGEFTPETNIGKILATLNGVLGIAIFALPAGIIASGFVDEIGDDKKSKEINDRKTAIDKVFMKRYVRKKILDNRVAHTRYYTFEDLGTRLLFSDQEILESVRSSENLRFRAMKSNESLKYNDIKLVERFVKNVSYGCILLNKESNVFIVNPMGKSERCISHFTFTLIDNLGYNYISREIAMETTEETVIGTNYSIYYPDFENNKDKLPKEFHDFMYDLSNINENDYVILICSAASGRGDFIVEYGNKKGQAAIEIGVSTFTEETKLDDFISSLKSHAENTVINRASAKKESYSFSMENHTIGNFDNKWIGKTIHNLTGANVLTLYINISLLTGEDGPYYASLKCVIEVFEEVFGNNNKKNM